MYCATCFGNPVLLHRCCVFFCRALQNRLLDLPRFSLRRNILRTKKRNPEQKVLLFVNDDKFVHGMKLIKNESIFIRKSR